MTPPPATRTITVYDEDDQAYTISEIPGFFDISTADGYGYFICEAGPVICIDPGVYEIWVSDEWGPHKVIAREREKPALTPPVTHQQPFFRS
jgi:hypothetical protein